MENPQDHTLSDFEIKEKQSETLFYVISWIYGLLIASFVIYNFWPFSKRILTQISIDSELQMLTAIHVIYPSVALGLFIAKKKLGWSLIVFSSILNAAYGIFAYGNDLLTSSSPIDILKDKMIFFFLFHIIIIVLIFRQSLIQDLDMSRKYFLYTTRASIIVSALFLLLLFTTYN